MIIYGAYKANAPCMIDFIEMAFKDFPEKFKNEYYDERDESKLTVLWDMSDWGFNEEAKEGDFRLKGVTINEVYANGCLYMFPEAVITCMQIYGPEDAGFELTGLEIYDAGDIYDFPEDKLKPEELWYEAE